MEAQRAGDAHRARCRPRSTRSRAGAVHRPRPNRSVSTSSRTASSRSPSTFRRSHYIIGRCGRPHRDRPPIGLALALRHPAPRERRGVSVRPRLAHGTQLNKTRAAAPFVPLPPSARCCASASRRASCVSRAAANRGDHGRGGGARRAPAAPASPPDSDAARQERAAKAAARTGGRWRGRRTCGDAGWLWRRRRGRAATTATTATCSAGCTRRRRRRVNMTACRGGWPSSSRSGRRS